MKPSTVAAAILTVLFFGSASLAETLLPWFEAKTWLIAIALFFAFVAFLRATPK